LRSRVGTEYDLSSTALKKMIGQSTGVFGKYAKRAKVRKTAEKLAKHMRMEPEKESKGERNLEEIVGRVGIAMAKKLTKDAIEQLREEGLLGLQTQELDPMKDWKEIIQNYIVFDEIIPPTPNRPRKKRKETEEERARFELFVIVPNSDCEALLN